MRNSSKAVREGAMMIALTVILVLMTYYVPFFSMIGTFLCGVPMAALAVRNGLKAALPAVLGVLAVTAIVTGSFIAALSTVLISVVPGLAAGWCMGKEKPFFTTLAVCCLAVCAGFLIEFFVIDKVFTGQGAEAMIKESVDLFREILEKVIASGGDRAKALSEVMDEALAMAEYMIKLYFPAMVIAVSAVYGYVIMRLSAFILRRANIKKVYVVPFSRMKAPRSMANVAVLIYACSIFMKQDTLIWSVAANATAVLLGMVGVCGLSLVDYKLGLKLPKSGVRALIYAAVFFMGGFLFVIAAYILVFAGLFDSTRNYRQIDSQTEYI